MQTLTQEEIIAKLEAIGFPLLKAVNVNLVELQVRLGRTDVKIVFMADKPTGGITIHECADLNRSIVEAVDLDGFLGENYSLEFSSPGLDRPLMNEKDFTRNLNYPVRIELKEAIGKKKECVGVIIRVNIGDVVLLTKQKKEIIVPYTVIERAVLVI